MSRMSAERKKRVTFVILGVAYFGGGIELSVSVPRSWRCWNHEEESAGHVYGMVVAVYGVATLFMGPFVGRWMDRPGRCKRLLLIGSFLHTAAAAVELSRAELLAKILARFLSGIGGCMDIAVLSESSRYISTQNPTSAMALLIGARLVGCLIVPGLDVFMWKKVFLHIGWPRTEIAASALLMLIFWSLVILAVLVLYTELCSSHQDVLGCTRPACHHQNPYFFNAVSSAIGERSNSSLVEESYQSDNNNFLGRSSEFIEEAERCIQALSETTCTASFAGAVSKPSSVCNVKVCLTKETKEKETENITALKTVNYLGRKQFNIVQSEKTDVRAWHEISSGGASVNMSSQMSTSFNSNDTKRQHYSIRNRNGPFMCYEESWHRSTSGDSACCCSDREKDRMDCSGGTGGDETTKCNLNFDLKDPNGDRWSLAFQRYECLPSVCGAEQDQYSFQMDRKDLGIQGQQHFDYTLKKSPMSLDSAASNLSDNVSVSHTVSVDSCFQERGKSIHLGESEMISSQNMLPNQQDKIDYLSIDLGNIAARPNRVHAGMQRSVSEAESVSKAEAEFNVASGRFDQNSYVQRQLTVSRRLEHQESVFCIVYKEFLHDDIVAILAAFMMGTFSHMCFQMLIVRVSRTFLKVQDFHFIIMFFFALFLLVVVVVILYNVKNTDWTFRITVSGLCAVTFASLLFIVPLSHLNKESSVDNFVQLLLCVGLYILGFSLLYIGGTTIYIMLSVPQYHGLSQGIYHSVHSVSTILAPFWVEGSLKMPFLHSGVVVSLLLFSMILVLCSRKSLSSVSGTCHLCSYKTASERYRPQPERHCSTEEEQPLLA